MSQLKKITKILIANRGEIARRIIRTARRMGIATVAVYSETDSQMPFVAEADEAVALGGVEAKDSYLVIDKILDACRQTGADAVHPGYGFLAENAAFARALDEAGITFIGPRPETMELMGDKIRARAAMIEAGVPVVPGYDGADQSPAALEKEASRIGYPLMIKASAGGGGKGMRLVEKAEAFQEALEAAKREAMGAFGDDRVFIEKFVTGPRHIEVQVAGDGQGNIYHFFERECSIQRRHQKVIEETPSPFLSDEQRAKITATAVQAAQKVDYISAGTVEFIASSTGDFYFLEMNTRLQVEHPVTELVCNIDLVELMIKAAQGEAFGFAQKDITQKGWAVEARLYAEDPENGFLPAVGQLHFARYPDAEGVRVDAGVETGNEVSIYFDPMIAKICGFGPNRKVATANLIQALKDTVIFGLRTNRMFLIDVLSHKQFAQGDTTTGFIEQNYGGRYAESEILTAKLEQSETAKLALAVNLCLSDAPALEPSLAGGTTAWEAVAIEMDGVES